MPSDKQTMRKPDSVKESGDHFTLAAQPVEGPRCGASREYVGFIFTCFKERAHEGSHEGNTQDRRQPSHSWGAAPVEGVERVTDDRPAETIPDDKTAWQAILKWAYANEPDAMRSIQKLADEVVSARTAETRIEVLEAALRDVVKQFPVTFAKYAALAAPSGETK